MFRVRSCFESVPFRSCELRFESILDQLIFCPINLSCKNKQPCQKFRVEYDSVRINSDFGSTFDEPIFDVGSGMDSGTSV